MEYWVVVRCPNITSRLIGEERILSWLLDADHLQDIDIQRLITRLQPRYHLGTKLPLLSASTSYVLCPYIIPRLTASKIHHPAPGDETRREIGDIQRNLYNSWAHRPAGDVIKTPQTGNKERRADH